MDRKIHPYQMERFKNIKKLKDLSLFREQKIPFYCNPDGNWTKSFFCGEKDPKFKKWVNSPISKETILYFGPYYKEILINGEVYPSHYPELIEYYEKFDQEYTEKYIAELEMKIINFEKDSEKKKMLEWYLENKENHKIPQLVLKSVFSKISNIIKIKEKIKFIKYLPSDRYKRINNLGNTRKF